MTLHFMSAEVRRSLDVVRDSMHRICDFLAPVPIQAEHHTHNLHQEAVVVDSLSPFLL